MRLRAGADVTAFLPSLPSAPRIWVGPWPGILRPSRSMTLVAATCPARPVPAPAATTTPEEVSPVTTPYPTSDDTPSADETTSEQRTAPEPEPDEPATAPDPTTEPLQPTVPDEPRSG